MNWKRITGRGWDILRRWGRAWWVAGAVAVLIAAAGGYALGSGAAGSGGEAESARQDGYEQAYNSTFARALSITAKRGLDAGRKRGEIAGEEIGTREGFDLGAGEAGVEAARADAEAAEAAEATAEAEIADRQANCGTIPAAPDVCPTDAELADYRAALEAAKAASRPERIPKKKAGDG